MLQPEDAQPQRLGRLSVLASGQPRLRRSQRRPRGESGRDASCLVPTEQPFLQCRTHSRTGGVSLQAFGTPGLLFRTRGRTGFEGEVAFSKHGPERIGPGRSARSRRGARSHREKLLRGAEAVGGGRRRWVGEAIALLSPKSKVLGGAINRARRGGSLCRLPSANLRLCGEPRHGAPALSPQPARRDECA